MRRNFLVALTAALVSSGAPAGAAVLHGRVLSGGTPLASARVTLYRAGAMGPAVALGSARTDVRGRFALLHGGGNGGVRYLIAERDGVGRLAAVLRAGNVPSRVVLDERTTVAAGFALAQFVSSTGVAGRAPGPRNAAAMAANIADVRTGGLGVVLRRAPNGDQTSAVRTVNTLANLLLPCARSRGGCADLFRLASPPGRPVVRGALQAIAAIARTPWHSVAGLARLAAAGPAAYRPALRKAPGAWTLALRFVGDGRSMNGPGNMAVDARGDVWVTNNYDYSPNPFTAVCGGEVLLRFAPDGRYVAGSPYRGGGVSGSGFGITFDPRGNLWEGNFGFAAPDCPVQPPHNSISEFTAGGVPLSPSSPSRESPTGGFTIGGIDWPQGTVSDRQGDIWIANCGNDTVTRYRAGDPKDWQSIGGLGIGKPFDIALNLRGQAFVTGNDNDAVAILDPDGTPAAGSPVTGGGLSMPLGIAADSRGNMWVANSSVISVPCPDAAERDTPPASVTLISAEGKVLSPSGFRGGGITIPWGLTVDGADNVWVANFAGKRLSEFCGTRRTDCPPGARTGDPISPSHGYGFDGLVRNTGVQIDPSGNAWVANNWKTVPVQTNPGGYQMVVFLGLARPIRTPLIGPPQG